MAVDKAGLIAGGVTAGLGGLFTLGSTIAGLVGSKKQNDKAQGELDSRKADEDAWYNQKINEDYMMRSDVQNVLKKHRDLYQESMKMARATNLVAGGTDASLALQQQGATKAVGETMSDIASNATAYKDAVEAQHRQAKADLSTQQQQIYNQRAEAIAQAASQAANMGTAAMGAGLQGVVNSVSKQKV